jgi:hypothetical protein
VSEQLVGISDIELPASDQGVAFRETRANTLTAMTEATNAVLKAARRRSNSIQNLNYVIGHLLNHPDEDRHLRRAYEKSGYLAVWQLELAKSGWQYELDLMRAAIHQHLTDRIVAAIEAGAGMWQMPWHRGSGGHAPVNISSGNGYRGINVLALWVEAQVHGYGSHLWGTYCQWAEKGATVRKASYVWFSTSRLRSRPTAMPKTIPGCGHSLERPPSSMRIKSMA